MKKCFWCGKEFKTNRRDQKFCSLKCREKANLERKEKYFTNYNEEMQKLVIFEDYQKATKKQSNAENSRWQRQENVSDSYQDLLEKMKKRIENDEDSIGDPLDKEIYKDFMYAINIYKKYLGTFEGNKIILKLLLRRIARSYFHMGDFENSVKYYHRAEEWGRLDSYTKYIKEWAIKFNEIEQEYYKNKGYSKEEIKKITPKVITLEKEEDSLIKIAEKFFRKNKIIKSFITDKYDTVLDPRFSLNEFEEFNGLPLLQIFNEKRRKGIQIEMGSNLTPSVEYSFYIISKRKKEIYEAILVMNSFIKLITKIFDVSYSLDINKPSEISSLDDYGNVLDCKSIKELEKIIENAKKENWRFIEKNNYEKYNYIIGQISLSYKGYNIELKDKIYIKGQDNKMELIDLSDF